MTPQQLLAHHDLGELWPADGDGHAALDLPAAYQLALQVRALRIARGEIPRGFKIGFTNRNIWPRYQVFAPIWGSVWNTTLSFDEGDNAASLGRLCQPRIEPEAVFGMRATPPANASVDDLYQSLDWVAPGFEIVQSHMPDWKFTASQTIADGGLHGRLLVGHKVPVQQIARNAAQLNDVLAGARLQLRRNGDLVEEGAGANVLDSPLQALLHFVTELRACRGAPDLAAGDVVTTGTWTDAWPVQRGDTWTVKFNALLPPLAFASR